MSTAWDCATWTPAREQRPSPSSYRNRIAPRRPHVRSSSRSAPRRSSARCHSRPALRARSRPPSRLPGCNDCPDTAQEHRGNPSARFGGDVHARGCLPLRPAPPRGRGRAVRGPLQLPCVPAPHRERLRDAGRLQGGSGTGQRSVQRLLPHLGRGGRKEHVFHFCPDCGSQVFYTEPTEPDLVVVSVGAFADPSFPSPTESGYDSRRHPGCGCPSRSRATRPSCGTRYARLCGRQV